MIQIFLLLSGLATLILRVIVGVIFLAHGWKKLKHYKGTIEWFRSIGFRPAQLWGTLCTFAELIGGAMLVLGFFTQLVAIALLINMLVAVTYNILSRQGFFKTIELDLILIAALFMIVSLGSGPLAMDMYLGFRW